MTELADTPPSMKAIVDFETIMREYPVDGWVVANAYRAYVPTTRLIVSSIVCQHVDGHHGLYFPYETKPGWRIKWYESKEQAITVVTDQRWFGVTVMRFPEMRHAVMTDLFLANASAEMETS